MSTRTSTIKQFLVPLSWRTTTTNSRQHCRQLDDQPLQNRACEKRQAMSTAARPTMTESVFDRTSARDSAPASLEEYCQPCANIDPASGAAQVSKHLGRCRHHHRHHHRHQPRSEERRCFQEQTQGLRPNFLPRGVGPPGLVFALPLAFGVVVLVEPCPPVCASHHIA